MAGSGTLRDIGNASIWGVATARAGGDTIDTNGFNVTIDQDTRYGLSGTTSTSLGSVTINATKGGNFNIDARYVRMIPFTGGSGTITVGTLITCGSGTGKVIGLYSALNAAPVLTGVATGWVKVTEWNSVAFPTSGAFTQAGYTFTISGASIVGFIEVVGDEASTINANRLGTVNMQGEWFEVGTTSGLSGTTYQLPTNGGIYYCPAVWVETATSSGIYEAIPCAGSLAVASSTATDIRGKCCWISTAGLLRFGSDGTNITGYIIPSGRKIRVPNIILSNCAVAARTANVLPAAVLATRYDFTTTGGGVIVMNKVSCNWYPSIAQPFSVSMTNVGIATQLSITECAQAMTLTGVCVGQEAANTQTALILGLCFEGGTITDCVFTRAGLATAVFVNTVTDCEGFTFSNCRTESRLVKANVGAGSWSLTRAVSCTWTGNYITGAKAVLVACTNLTWTNTHYNDRIVSVTTTTAAENNSVWELVTANSSGLKFEGLDFNAIINTAPYISVLNVNVAGCTNVKMRNMGTYASPLALGTATVFTGAPVFVAAGAALSDFKGQRCYFSNTRLNGFYFGTSTAPDNSSTRWTLENCFTDYADSADLNNVLNLSRKGCGGIPSLASAVSIYGTHFQDYHTSTTAGRLAIIMNEASALTASQVTLTNGAAFTSAGGLYMPTVGMTATFETPGYLIGHTGFSASVGAMAGGTVGNYLFRWQIDKNNGAGWSTITAQQTQAAMATAMNAIASISAVNGWKLRLEIATTTANTTAITSFTILTTSTTTTQAYQYALDTNTVTFTGPPTGTDMVVLTAGTTTVLYSSDAASTFVYTYSGAQTVDVGFIKTGYIPYYIRNLSLSTTDSSIPVAMTADRNFI